MFISSLRSIHHADTDVCFAPDGWHIHVASESSGQRRRTRRGAPVPSTSSLLLSSERRRRWPGSRAASRRRFCPGSHPDGSILKPPACRRQKHRRTWSPSRTRSSRALLETMP